MFHHLRILFLMITLIFHPIFSAPSVSFIPKQTKAEDVERKLEKILREYYEKIVENIENLNRKTEKANEKEDIYDTMQGDQPVENTINQNIEIGTSNYSYQGGMNLSDPQYSKVMRDM